MSDDRAYESYDSGDPKGTHKHDQLHAEAVETLRKSKSFALFTTDDTDEGTLRMRAGFVPGVDRSDYLEGMSKLIWRIYFERCLAMSGIVTLGDLPAATDTFLQCGIDVLEEMRQEDA